MNSRPKQPKYARNKNVVVIGGSGSGKTRFFVKPNLMQLHSSYVLTEALNALPERKRDIILLSYFLDMSDAEIGELLNVVRTTVFRHRKSALAKIKQYLEGKADDEYR